MEKKDRIDAFGATALIGFALLLAFNQVVIKVVNVGLQPVFFAGLRSAGAALCLWAWLALRGQSLALPKAARPAALAAGIVFGLQFILLFIALDLTTVARTSVIFYSMPVWTLLLAHFLLPGERVSGIKAIGLALAMAGVAWAFVGRQGGEASLAGDLAALGGALCWASLTLILKRSALSPLRPETQLFWQVAISAPLLLAAAPLFGDLIRELEPLHLWGLAFQIVIVVSAGFVAWLWLLSIYPASGVASFGFLSPVFGVGLGWLLLDETVGRELIGALALVAIGLVLINRQVPQKV